MKACLETSGMFCYREKLIASKVIQWNENLHKELKVKYGWEALQLLQLWEKSVIRECNYRNHRLFTLRCISDDLVLVSVRLKSACCKISQGARKIIEKAERQLLQDRVKCINRTIEATINIINNSRSSLASIVTNTMETSAVGSSTR